MKKILNIGWKDLIVTFRDRSALILMLAAPLVLTIGMGLVTGSFSDSDDNTGISAIPVLIMNEDEGQLGQALADLLAGEELSDLLAADTTTDLAAARAQIDNDEIAAVVVIPAGFTAGIIPDESTGAVGEAAPIAVYTNPARPISSGIVESIVTGFINEVDTRLLSGQVAVTQLVSSGLVSPQEIPAVAQAVGQRLTEQESGEQLITLNRNSTALSDEEGFNLLAYFATGMAVFFLMYTVTVGGRSILTERQDGTLPRMLISPTTTAQVLGGKVLGVFLTGFAQVAILIVATSLMFGLQWGDPLGVVVLVAAVSAAATGWGILLAAFAKTPGQISSLGTSLMLIFGILGGTFISVEAFSGTIQTLSKITPNAWALDGFVTLNGGGVLTDITTPLAALLAMAALLFGAAVITFRRRWESIV